MKSLNKEVWVMVIIAIVSFLFLVGGTSDCTTVAALLTTCSNFISYGTPDPVPGSSCCNALVSLKIMAESTRSNQKLLCRCLMGLIITYNTNATAIATMPGLCGVSIGFTIDPNTNCN
ncbi:putative non-specific lipid-transfer protein 14 [Macadamia integrifolia]|uniref:putative non-specific lipid-transfer protein 14 n=1 Tax=Macadamia integrifolia TaxID=60698 RepID=UPI001C4E6B62|nr:putative non-specific lipid-transfer protein 14 [Macadamia integrifolia]